MQKKGLDFLVFGLARSGTSATARYLSATVGVHCGQEVFGPAANHAELEMPTAFLEASPIRRSDSSAIELADRSDEIVVWGNKTPGYSYSLDRIRRELPDAPCIACFRDPEKVARSYSTRAAAERDPWVPGRVGIYGLGDALMLAHILANIPDGENILLLPQRALSEDWRGSVERALSFVAPDHPIRFRDGALEHIATLKTRQEARKKAPLEQVERLVARRLKDGGLTEFFEQSKPVLLSDVKDELRAVLKECPPHPIAFMKRMAVQHPSEEARAYLERWLMPASRCWSQMKARAV